MNREVKQQRVRNHWKWAFLILLGIMVGTMCFLVLRVTTEREPSTIAKQQTIEDGQPAFQVNLSKSQTNELINYYLDEFQKDSPVKYKFTLKNQALLKGTFQFLGHDLDFYLYFDPLVKENGDVMLKAKSISIGTLSLPISELMNYMKKNFKLPPWVEIDTKNEVVLLHMKEFRLKGGMYFGADRIDLLDDVINFNVFLPTSDTKN